MLRCVCFSSSAQQFNHHNHSHSHSHFNYGLHVSVMTRVFVQYTEEVMKLKETVFFNDVTSPASRLRVKLSQENKSF